jgi:hypothetical protein
MHPRVAFADDILKVVHILSTIGVANMYDVIAAEDAVLDGDDLGVGGAEEGSEDDQRCEGVHCDWDGMVVIVVFLDFMLPVGNGVIMDEVIVDGYNESCEASLCIWASTCPTMLEPNECRMLENLTSFCHDRSAQWYAIFLLRNYSKHIKGRHARMCPKQL